MNKNKSRKRVMLYAIAACIISSVSCSNKNSVVYNKEEDKTFQTYIDVNPNSETRTELEREQFKEATDRFSSRLIESNDGTFSLIDGTTADELQISPELFELFNNVIVIFNETVLTKTDTILNN